MNDEERKLVAQIIENLVNINTRLNNIEKILSDASKTELKAEVTGSDLAFILSNHK